MKWFKHYTDSLDDPFIQILLDNFGHKGYTAWFGLIEIICKENKNDLTGELEISPTYLKRKLRISTTKLQQIFHFCETNDKLLCSFFKESWHFKFYKILEIKDNYTKDLQGACKKVSTDKEKDKEKEEDKDKKEKHIVVGVYKEEEFRKIYKDYPANRRGIFINCLLLYKESVKGEVSLSKFKKAINNYNGSEEFKNKRIKNFDNFLLQWENWVDYKSEPKSDPMFLIKKEKELKAKIKEREDAK